MLVIIIMKPEYDLITDFDLNLGVKLINPSSYFQKV